MLLARLSKVTMVAAIAFYASLVAFGNITDYGTNYAFVEHVLRMDTIFPDATIKYRAIDNPVLFNVFYIVIITAESITAVLCWIGAARLLGRLNHAATSFNQGKTWAVAGLTLGFLTWQVAFMSVGGEWFGMWQSTTWNGEESAFRVFITICAVLIFVSLPDDELAKQG